MAATEALDIMEQIQALVNDRLQVVSYKWLSRNFSIPSDDAKRTLQVFVEKHGSDLEVVYAMSGWLKSDPHSYHVKLVPAIKLSEARKQFKDNCSVQVYSVQTCIPNDPAVLWSSEFVQAEELFDQPTAVNNCLRDNRFCAILNSSVKRNIEENVITDAVPKIHTGRSVDSKTSGSIQNLKSQPNHEPKSRQQIGSIVVPNKLNLDKEKSIEITTSKLNDQNEKSQLNNGSLRTLWSCEYSKQKQSTSVPESTNGMLTSTTTVGANKVSTHELLNASAHDKNKEQYCDNARKRKAVFDLSDDEAENEDIVSLASPEPPKSHSVQDYKENSNSASLQTHNASSVGQYSIKRDIEKEKEDSKALELSAVCKSEDVTKIKDDKVLEKTQGFASEQSADKDCAANNTASLSKRKKILKTRIDERGREVTEVVWEEQHLDSGALDKNTVSNVPGIRQSKVAVPTPAPAPVPSAPSNQVGKAGNKKVAKGGKDTKQGNIMSFFKRI